MSVGRSLAFSCVLHGTCVQEARWTSGLCGTERAAGKGGKEVVIVPWI